jgi:hypothetical protein
VVCLGLRTRLGPGYGAPPTFPGEVHDRSLNGRDVTRRWLAIAARCSFGIDDALGGDRDGARSLKSRSAGGGRGRGVTSRSTLPRLAVHSGEPVQENY